MVKIRLPKHNRKANAKMDPYFQVQSVPLIRQDNHELTGVNGLYNASNGKKLSTVSDDYKVILHKEASDMVKELLNGSGIPFESSGAEVASNGARFFETIVFPSLKFNPANNDSTALDANFKREDIFPAIIIRNSYDKTAPICWSYATYRLICGNGAAVLSQFEKFSYKHNQTIDMNKIQDRLLTRLNQSVDLMMNAYGLLNGTGGIKALNTLIESRGFGDKFKAKLIENLAGNITMDQKLVKDEVTGRSIMEISNLQTPLSAWAIYNAATDVSTHALTNRTQRELTNNRIAQVFEIAI
jgi:hypothetical protein